MSNFWGPFFYVFMGKKYIYSFFENIVASTLKSCIEEKVKKSFKKIGKYFLQGKNQFFLGLKI